MDAPNHKTLSMGSIYLPIYLEIDAITPPINALSIAMNAPR
jgi:hypothetical protein